MFINDVRLVQWRMSSTRARVTVIAGLIAALLIVLQVAAVRAGFQGPLHSLASDYVATPKSTTVPWVGLGVALVGLSNRHRIYALAAAVALDAAFAAERWLRAGVVAFGNGPVIVLTALTVLVCWRWDGIQRATALKGIAFATLFVLATKVGDAWLRLTPIIRPKVLDEYVLLADHALAQPSWLVGRALDWAGAAASGLLHWVYIELPVAALIVALYQLRNVTTAGWPRHFLIRTFLLLGLVGPLIYVMFPVVGPIFAFGAAGQGFQAGDYWPHIIPSVDLTPSAIPFDRETPRNCMPSMHTAWATAVFIHTRRAPHWLRWGGTFWLVGTLLATLGFGYHYGVDLVAGALLCLTVESILRQPVRGAAWSQFRLAAVGSGVFTAVLLCCRYLPESMARYPVLFGPLLVAALAAFAVAFYVTFFPRSGTVETAGAFRPAEPAPAEP